MKPETVKYLQRLASQEMAEDDKSQQFNPFESSSGNFDDAYSQGKARGRVMLARYILEKEGIPVEETPA